MQLFKNISKKILTLVSVGGMAFALLYLLSCEIGLGSAVDTEAPTVKIDYPPASSIIKGQFVLAGSCADDKEVAKVTCTVTNTETGASFGTFDATVNDSKGTWSIKLNNAGGSYNGWSFPDGKYDISAYATDSSGRTSGQSERALEIDNTAPLFILSSPGVTTIKSPSSYGSLFKVTGEIADDHTVKTMKVTVYDSSANKTKIGEYTSGNINTAGGTSVKIAKYVKNGTDTLNTNYNEIYAGGGTEATRNYYSTITLADAAKQYINPDESENTTTGNETSLCYLYNNVYTKFQSLNGYGLELSTIKKLVNGTYSESDGSLTAAEQEKIKTEFLAEYTDTAVGKTPVAFSLNPKANPVYVLSGYEVAETTMLPAMSAAKNARLTVIANAGLDGTYINPSTMCVYMFGPYDSLTSDVLNTIYTDPAEYAAANTSLVFLKETPSSEKSYSAVATFPMSVTIPDSVKSDKKYVVAATGKDLDGLDFDNDSIWYGFTGAVSGASPTLIINTPVQQTMYATSAALTVSGTAVSDSNIESITYIVTVTDETQDNKAVGTISGKVTNYNTVDKSWSFDVSSGTGYDACKAEAASGKVYQYYIQVKALGSNSLSSNAERYVHIDAENPAVSVPEVSHTAVNSEGKECVYGTVLVSGSVSDSYLSTVSMTATDGTKKETFDFGQTGSYKGKQIDTTLYSGTLTITVSAADKAGNTAEQVVTYPVDQNLDAPVIVLSNASAAVAADKISSENGNLFNTSANNKLLGSVTDVDKIESVTITAYDYKNSVEITAANLETYGLAANPFEKTAVGSSSYAISYTLPTKESVYRITVTAKDSKYAEAASDTVRGYRTASSTYYVAVDKGAPVITITTTSGAYTAADTAKAVAGTAEDSGGIASIKRYAYNSSTNTLGAYETTCTYDAATGKWTDTIAADIIGSTGATKRYMAQDIYGNTAPADFVYLVDAQRPAFTITKPVVLGTGIVFNKNNIYEITGTASDDTKVGAVYYTVVSSGAKQPASAEVTGGSVYTDVSAWSAASLVTLEAGSGDSKTWTANVNLSSLADGTYNVYVCVIDTAGNKSLAAEQHPVLVADSVAPVSTFTLTGTVYDAAGTEVVSPAAGGSYLAKADVTLGGKITEANFESAVLTISKNDAAAVTTSFTTFDGSAGDWIYKQPASAEHTDDGKYAYTVTLTDKAGFTTAYAVTVLVDTTAPELTVTSPAANESVEQNTKEFKGTITDSGCGYKNITYTLTNSSGEKTEKTFTPAGESWNSGSVSLGTKQGTLTLELYAADKLDNKTETKSITFYYDDAYPVISETTVGVSGKVTNGAFTLAGKASDTNALAAYSEGVSGPVTITDTVTTTDDKTSSAKTYLNVASDGTWTKDFAKGSIADGTHVFTITATDAAGKQTQLSRTVTVDTKNPEISSAAFTTVTYGSTEWFNTASLKITASAADTAANTNTGAATGVSAVEYSTDYGTVTDKSAANWISLTRGTSAWNGTVSASDGTNTIYFMVSDAAGNSAVWGSTLTAKVDTAKPAACTVTLVKNGETQLTDTELASLLADSASLLVNKTKDVTITVKPADSGSGAASVKCGTAAGSANGDGTYTITIAKDNLATGSLSAVVTDTAGNSETFRLFSVQVDSIAPVVKIASPDAASTVNKKITLSGTASDAVSLGNVYLSIKTTGEYTKLNGGSPLTVTDTNWSYTLDTTAYDSTGTDTAVSIKLTAEDAAGNSSETERAFTVNQNSDRPVLILSNIKSSGTLLKSKTVYGTVTDDDGTIKGLWYTTDATLAAGTTVPTTADDNGWTKITVSNGSWSADSSAGDGDTTWYFYVIDGAGGLFTTKASSALERPYITDSAAEKQDNTTGVSFKVDTVAPEIQTMALSRAATGTTTGAKEYNADTSNVWITTNNTSFGGNYGILYAKVTVYEQTGMDSTAPAVLSTDTAITPVLISTDTNVYTYVIGPLDFTKKSGESYVYADGTLSVSVTAKDAAGTTNVKSLNVIVDNTAPSVSVTYPGTTSSDAVTSTVTMKGTAADNAGGSGVAKLYYRIPKISGDVETWTELSGTAAWEIPFTSTETGNAMNILTYANATYAASYGASGLWKVPVYFKMTDELGNTATDTSHYIVADSEGGKPTAEIIYPALTAGGENPTAGGTINVYGTATDDVAVVTVRVQLDVNGDSSYDSSDYTLISGWTGTAVCSALTGTASDWYILASGTNSWKLAVDSSKLSSGVTTIGMRVCAYDAVPQTRGWTDTLTVKIDKDVPQIGSPNALKVVQYASGSSGTTTLEREYSSGMYISSSAGNGNWYLTGSCSDDQCVSSFVLKTVSSSSATYISCDYEEIGMTAAQYNFSIPLTTSADGQIYSLLTVTDDKGTSSQQYISINIDSTAPAMYERSGDTISDKDVSTSVKANLQDKLRLVSSSETLSKDNPVVNSNTVYTFGDTVTEAGSGLKYIAFYMERVGTESRVYCPMYNASTTEATSNKTVINTGITSGTTAGDVYINTDGLAVLYATDTSRSAADSFTSDTIKSNYNVRKGGLIKIGGAYSRITTVDNTSGIVTFSPTVSTTFTTAEIVYAQVVDHMLTEGPTGTDYTKVQNDDGDGMIESIKNTGSAYEWTASIFSDRIPDGPVQVHVVVIDDAGNVNSGYVTTSIQNSRPKLTQVILGTDLNLDGSISESEEVKYSAIVNDAATASAEIDALSKFTAKSDSEIIPEIVGGNGTLYYVWDYYNGTASDWGTKQTGSSTLVALTTTDGTTTVNGKEVAARTGTITLAVTDEKLAGKVSDGQAKLVYTFWDSTEETKPGTDSQYATLSIALNVDVVDDTCPKTVISPFYWTTLNNNSVYGSDTQSGGTYVVKKTSQLAGHIELENDWKKAAGYDSAATSGEYDGDAKVSGQIVVRGTAYDDHLITALYMTIDGFTFPNADTSTAPSATQFGFAADGARTTASSGKTYYQVATCSKGTWTNSDYWSSYGWKFTAATKTLDESGHTVTWELDWDTSKLSTIAGADKVIRIIAEDARSVPNASSETAGTGNTPLYQVDVVPYITGITTGLAAKNSSNPTVFTRTSDGHYSVRENETITVKGFNFATTSAPKMTVYTSHDATPASEELTAASGFTSSSVTFTLDANIVSGAMDAYTVTSSEGTLVALNNKDRTAIDSNMQPNDANNDLLTDDVYFDVWQFTTMAEPAVSALKNATVKVSPKDGHIGASFSNFMYFNMAGIDNAGTYRTQTPFMLGYNGCGENTFSFDSNGYTYGSVQWQSNSNNAESGYFQFFLGRAKNETNASKTKGTFSLMEPDDGYYANIGSTRLEANAVNLLASPSRPTSKDDPLLSEWMTNLERITSPSIVAKANSDSSLVTVYIAYCDRQTHQLRFRQGNVDNGTFASNTVTAATGKAAFLKNGTDSNSITGSSLRDVFDFDGTIAGTSYNYNLTGGGGELKASTTDAPNYPYTKYYCFIDGKRNICPPDSLQTVSGQTIHIIASSGMSNSNYQDVYQTSANNGVGDYCALAVLSDGTVVIAWEDDSSQLRLTYYKDPSSLTDAAGYTWATRTAKWVEHTSVIDNGGAYVQMTADAADNLHLAYYDETAGDLKYAYIQCSSYVPQTGSKVIETVDSYADVGEHCTLTVGKSGTNYIPYIGYYSSRLAKVAYRLSGDSSKAGASNDLYTGDWAISYVPSSTSVSEDTVSAAMYVNSKGELNAIPSASSLSSSDTVAATASAGNKNVVTESITNTWSTPGYKSNVYANGTSNPIVAYITKDGVLQMAQIK